MTGKPMQPRTAASMHQQKPTQPPLWGPVLPSPLENTFLFTWDAADIGLTGDFATYADAIAAFHSFLITVGIPGKEFQLCSLYMCICIISQSCPELVYTLCALFSFCHTTYFVVKIGCWALEMKPAAVAAS